MSKKLKAIVLASAMGLAVGLPMAAYASPSSVVDSAVESAAEATIADREVQITEPIDGRYDNNAHLTNDADVSRIRSSVRLVLTECGYRDLEDSTIRYRYSLGSAAPVHNAWHGTYLLTAEHVVECDPEFGYESLGGTSYLTNLDSMQALRESAGDKHQYIASHISEFDDVEVIDTDGTIDAAIIRTEHYYNQFNRAYRLGNSDDLGPLDYVLVVGYPLGISLNVNEGHVSSTTGPIIMSNPNDAFMFDASISPGNSGGPVFAVRDGTYELVGFVSHHYTRGNDMNVAYKINPSLEMLRPIQARQIEPPLPPFMRDPGLGIDELI